MLRIDVLHHQDPRVAARIHAVMVPAYAQEAALLRVEHFPALVRTPEDLRCSREFFLGAFAGAELVGLLSLGPDDEPGQIQVSMLVVHPNHQRRGVGRSLLVEALRRGGGMVFSVSTGAANAPALALYGALGFVAYRHGTTDGGRIALVKLRRAATSPAFEAPAHAEPAAAPAAPAARP